MMFVLTYENIVTIALPTFPLRQFPDTLVASKDSLMRAFV